MSTSLAITSFNDATIYLGLNFTFMQDDGEQERKSRFFPLSFSFLELDGEEGGGVLLVWNLGDQNQ